MTPEQYNYCQWCGRDCLNRSVGGAFCPTRFKDWQDVAEFEARVALRLAKAFDGLQNLYPPVEFPKIPYQKVLKDCRCVIEAEMEPE